MSYGFLCSKKVLSVELAIGQLSGQCFDVYYTFVISFKLVGYTVISNRSDNYVKRMCKPCLGGISVGIDKFGPLRIYYIRKNLNVQVAICQATVVKLKNGNNGFSMTHNAHTPLGHCHCLRFNIGKVKSFPEVFVYKTHGQIY